MPSSDVKGTSGRRERPHLYVTRPPTTIPYSGRPAGGGNDEDGARDDREAHARRLREEYSAVWKRAQEEAARAGRSPPTEVVVEVQGSADPDRPLALESLESPSRGMRLLAVREVQGRPYATVAVAGGKRDPLGRRLDEYADTQQTTRSGLPKNNPLFVGIESFDTATLASRWTDTIEMPDDADATGVWELWVDVETRPEEEIVPTVHKLAASAGIELSAQAQRFLDRVVFQARASLRSLAAAKEMLDHVAELRLAKQRPETVWMRPQTERRRIARGLVDRLALPAEASPYICLLDSGVNRGHPLLAPLLAADDLHTVVSAWGKQDNDHHGTGMAGLCLHGDLAAWVDSTGPMAVSHRLESSKIFCREGVESTDSNGAVMSQGISRVEIHANDRLRVFCMAVATPEGRDRGMPSSWSAEVDQQCWEREPDDVRRLMILCAGNSRLDNARDYPAGNLSDGIHDPGQAWNALTVGAFTERVELQEPEYRGWRALAAEGELGPSTTTSRGWARTWPLKPEIVMEGGNLAVDASDRLEVARSLRLLTTHHQPVVEPFDDFGDTSGATALASRMAAQIRARHPSLWPETVRALMVHSARWTAGMERQFPAASPEDHVQRIRAVGYGVPDLGRALASRSDALTLVVEASLTPYEGEATKEMHLHALPWPRQVLLDLGATPVTLRVTLSYFVEPNPARRGYAGKHPYPSHHLGFDLNNPAESVGEFRKRINFRENPENRGAR